MNKRQSKEDLLVNAAIKTTWRTSLLISLLILWDVGKWPTDALEEFIDHFNEFLDAYNNEPEDIQELVNAFREETGIDIRFERDKKYGRSKK